MAADFGKNSELLGASLLRFVETGILNRHAELIGQRLNHSHIAFVEGVDAIALDVQHADALAPGLDRPGQFRARLAGGRRSNGPRVPPPRRRSGAPYLTSG